MYDLIQQKVDYIILQPIVETGWEDAIHAAKEAGIPVIVADRKIAVDETEYVSWIGSDFEEEGRKAVTWLDQYLTEQGRENETIHIVLLEGTGRSYRCHRKNERYFTWSGGTSELDYRRQGMCQFHSGRRPDLYGKSAQRRNSKGY